MFIFSFSNPNIVYMKFQSLYVDKTPSVSADLTFCATEHKPKCN